MWCNILILTKDCANVFYVYLTDGDGVSKVDFMKDKLSV